MQIVWARGAVTVRDVYEALRARRPVAYTTVLTMLRVLARKGHVRVDRTSRAHVYRPAHSRHRVIAQLVREFVDRVFGGAAEPLVQHLVRDGRLSEEDLRALLRRLKDPAPRQE